MNLSKRPELQSTNVTRVLHRVSGDTRAEQNGHAGAVLWFTGLSGSGKSTLAVHLEHQLFHDGYHVYVLDGDNLRHGLTADLGFQPADREENIRRVGELAALFAEAGFIVIGAFISPYITHRSNARKASGAAFHEGYIKADFATCEARDVKGLYAKARTGEIPDFTGISAPYEAPTSCELVVDTNRVTVEESLARIDAHVKNAFPLTRR